MRHSAISGEKLIQTLKFEDETSKVILGNDEIELSPEEFTILRLIKEAEGAIVNMHQISGFIEHKKRNDAVFLNATVNGIKRKLGKAGKAIESVLGIGYRIKTEVL